MASVGNGTATFSLKPRQWNQGSDQYSTFNERSIYLMSVNAPMRWQVLYEKNTQGFTEAVDPTTDDVVNVVFTIYGTSMTIDAGAPFSKWEKVGVIKKSRDIANKTFGGISHTTYTPGHRFTVDISSICNDLLSYSLCPIGKGTWARDSLSSYNNFAGYRGSWGGMNGDGHPQDNLITRVSLSKITQNGAYRFIKVQAGFEILQDDGTVVTATNNQGSDILIRDESWVVAINSAPQWEEDSVYYSGGSWGTKYFMDRHSSSAFSFLSKCPNFSTSSGSGSEIMKDVRMTDEAEWLYFWIFRTLGDTYRDQDLTYWASGAMLEVKTSDGNTVYVDNFKNLLRRPFGQFVGQYRYCVQNVSPDFIANNAKDAAGAATGTPFTANTEWYSVRYVNIKNTDSSIVGMSQFRNYKIDREAEHPFGYVRFHWLNRLGGIDSYTAKRNVVEGVSVNKNTFEAKSPDKMWLQLNEPILLDDSVRGDLYRGGREVLNVNANRNHSVYTDPLNKVMAKWLEELITSPNVWIEHESEATKRRKSNTASLRPSDKTYIPIIITNSDVETVNQESGLVKFNIDFTHSHSINTQRN